MRRHAVLHTQVACTIKDTTSLDVKRRCWALDLCTEKHGGLRVVLNFLLRPTTLPFHRSYTRPGNAATRVIIVNDLSNHRLKCPMTSVISLAALWGRVLVGNKLLEPRWPIPRKRKGLMFRDISGQCVVLRETHSHHISGSRRCGFSFVPIIRSLVDTARGRTAQQMHCKFLTFLG